MVLLITRLPSAGLLLLKTPFSGSISVMRRPWTTIWISTDRGCTCGVLKPQGPRKPTAIPAPVPTSAGNDLRLAMIKSPPFPPLPLSAGLPKSKTKFSLSGSRAKRSAAVSARKSWAVRERPVLVAAGTAVMVVLIDVLPDVLLVMSLVVLAWRM